MGRVDISVLFLFVQSRLTAGKYPPTGTLTRGHCSGRAAIATLERPGKMPTLHKSSPYISAIRV